jgi:hypothetical protein
MLYIITGVASGQPPAKRDAFLEGSPFTLSALLDLLPVESEGRMLRAITARGVSFPLTPENLQKLVEAKVSAKVIDLIKDKAPAPTPPPPAPAPPEVPRGRLSLRCEPAECEFSVQGGEAASTKNGAATVPDLKPGEVFVDFKKPGYYSQQQRAVINANVETALAVKMEPDSETAVAFGKRLLAGMQQAVGGAAVRKDLATLTATGSATFFDPGGASSEWNLTAALRPGQLTLEAKSAVGTLKFECRGENCQANSGKKLIFGGLKPEQVMAIDAGLRSFRQWQFAAVNERLSSDQMRPTAKTGDVPASGDQLLRLESSSEVFNVTLDDKLRPSLVVFEPKSGLGSGLTIAYSDYVAVGDSQYPKTTEVKLPNSKQGVRIRLDPASAKPK